MADTNAGSQWERVAAELRACREAQQRAWGDIDNTTLGRYLAGEVSQEEQQHIDRALDDLPELRKLTDLVRDVLGEHLPANPTPVSYGHAVLPMPQLISPRQPILVRSSGQATLPSHNWLTERRTSDWRKRATLAMAACLLFGLGVALPRSSIVASPDAPESVVALSPVALHEGMPGQQLALLAPSPLNAHAFPLLRQDVGGKNKLFPKSESSLLVRVDASLRALEADGKATEARRLARQYVNNWTRQAMSYQEKGDLNRAETAWNQACQLCTQTLGPEAPETIRTRNSLADVYAVVLNSSPPQPSAFGSIDSEAAPMRAMAQNNESASPNHQARNNRHSSAVPVRSASAYRPAAPMASATTTPVLRERITRQSQNELRHSVVPVLTRALREAKNATECERLARALGQLGPASSSAVPALLDCLRESTDSSERSTLLLTLGQIGPAARPALPLLVESLGCDDPRVRASAARALVQLGPTARTYGKDLAKNSKHDALMDEVLQRLESPEGRCGIDDEAECFSVRTIQQARHQLRNLAMAAHVEVRIATVSGRAAGKDNEEDMKRQLCDLGVYLCIDKDASAAHVVVSDALRKRGLTEADLRRTLQPYLVRRDFDRGLRACLSYLADFEDQRIKK